MVLDAVGPLTFILEAAAQDKLTMVDAVDAAQTALKLLGNASCHLAMERRRNVLTDLNPSLKDMAEEDKLFKDAAPNLFGEGFLKKAKERDEELKVLKSTKQMPKKPTNWQSRDNQFFSRTPLLCTGHQGRRSIQRPQQTVCQTKALPTKWKVTDSPPQQPELKKQKTSQPTQMYHVFQSLPLVTNILVQDCYLKNIYQSTIVKQLLGMGLKDIAPTLAQK